MVTYTKELVFIEGYSIACRQRASLTFVTAGSATCTTFKNVEARPLDIPH
jgi:hypothetical protein